MDRSCDFRLLLSTDDPGVTEEWVVVG